MYKSSCFIDGQAFGTFCYDITSWWNFLSEHQTKSSHSALHVTYWKWIQKQFKVKFIEQFDNINYSKKLFHCSILSHKFNFFEWKIIIWKIFFIVRMSRILIRIDMKIRRNVIIRFFKKSCPDKWKSFSAIFTAAKKKLFLFNFIYGKLVFYVKDDRADECQFFEGMWKFIFYHDIAKIFPTSTLNNKAKKSIQ